MKRKVSLTLLTVFLLFSCSGFYESDEMEKKIGNSRDFNDILALKYIRYSDILRRNYDFVSASYFAKLGQKAYRKKMDFSFRIDDSLKKSEPDELADLYFLFNCWLYFEKEKKNLGEATICKNSFIKIIDILEKRRNISAGDKVIELEKERAKALTKEEERFYLEFTKNRAINIFFDFDSYMLNPESLVKISSVLKYINELKSDYRITVTGHADRVGKVIYNNTLARRRANTVYNVLIKNGVPRNLINVESLSSKSPKVLTRQEEKNQLNRRVEILIDTDYRGQNWIPQPIE
jgi:outer membrane protein OmpA-like peptidoglycan-associated protein